MDILEALCEQGLLTFLTGNLLMKMICVEKHFLGYQDHL